MAVHGKPSLFFNELRQLLQWAEHQINDFSTATTLNMMVVSPAMNHFIAHLSFMESDGIHQTQLLEHRQVTIDRYKIDIRSGLDQPRMHLSCGNGERVSVKNGKNGLSGLRQLLPACLETFSNRGFHVTSYMQVDCIYQFAPLHVKQPYQTTMHSQPKTYYNSLGPMDRGVTPFLQILFSESM